MSSALNFKKNLLPEMSRAELEERCLELYKENKKLRAKLLLCELKEIKPVKKIKRSNASCGGYELGAWCIGCPDKHKCVLFINSVK